MGTNDASGDTTLARILIAAKSIIGFYECKRKYFQLHTTKLLFCFIYRRGGGGLKRLKKSK